MDIATFQSKFGKVFEYSPWVADSVFESGVDSVLDDADALIDRFSSVFMESAPELQLATMQAHPMLVCALAEPVELTEDSLHEQSAAGLDQCTELELKAFTKLNTEYSEKFGFPFIVAVRGRERQKILNLFRMRLKNDAVLEYQTALRQVCQIAGFRIRDIVNG